MGKQYEGRPPGSGNKITRAVREIAQEFVNDPEYREMLRMRLICGEAPGMEKLLWHYAYGKPKVTVEVTAEAAVEKIVREIVDPAPAAREILAARREVVDPADSVH